MKKVLLGLILFTAQFFFAEMASAQEVHVGVYYCPECTFGPAGSTLPAGGDTVAFLRNAVAADIGSWVIPSGGALVARSVTVCNRQNCALIQYVVSGNFTQVGPQYVNVYDRKDFKNAADIPASYDNNTPPSGGGGGSSGSYPPGWASDPTAGCYYLVPVYPSTDTGQGDVTQQVPGEWVCP